jgi:hypothetical protein
MSIKHPKTLKASALSITALAASSVWGKTPAGLTGGGLGIDYLSLDEMPKQNVTVCEPPRNEVARKETFTGLFSDNIWISYNGAERPTYRVSFIVSDMVATDEDRMLFLVYSTRTSSSPYYDTTEAGPQLKLEMTEMEIMGMYSIPAVRIGEAPDNKLGTAIPTPASKMTVEFKFNANKLNTMLLKDKETIYVQAALIRMSDLESELFENMILSEMDTLTFIADDCPSETASSYSADNSGYVTKSSSQNSSANPNSNPIP